MNTTLRPARAAFEIVIAKMLSDLTKQEQKPGVNTVGVRFTRDVMPMALRRFADEIDAETNPGLLMTAVALLLSNMLVTFASASATRPEVREEAILLLLDTVTLCVLDRIGELHEKSMAQAAYHHVRSKGRA